MSDSKFPSANGEILVTLNSILEKKNISPRQFAQSIQCDPSKFNAFRTNQASVLHPDLLARLCYSLDCDLSELILYKKNGE